MKKSMWILIILAAVLCGLWFQSDLDGQCMNYHADGARWTVNGVYCVRQGVFREYYLLDDLREKHDGPKLDPIIRPSQESDV